MRSYKPEELFDAGGRRAELQALAPVGPRRMSANPHANGGLLRKPLKLPDFRTYAVEVSSRGTAMYENTKPLGDLATIKNNPTSFRVFGPDETASNRLQAVYEASKKTWMADMLPEDADGGELARDGRVMEMLSEHTLVGWLEGYLLTGRHGFFHTYEAFAHVIDSMFNQHAKWLDICKNHVPWRASVSSENILLSSTVWRQDHNGFSHQDPGFIDLVTNKGPSVASLPPDANTLLSVADHAFAAPTTSMSSLPTSRNTCSSRRSTRRSFTAPRASASGRGRAPMRARSRMSCWRPAATWPPWRRWRQPPSCASGRRI